MNPSIPKTMKAAVIDKFGGPEVLHVASIPVPELDADEVLVRVHTAGIGVWDPWLRDGGSGIKDFPLVLGSDGSGTVIAVGAKVRRVKVGDRVYGYAYDNPKGGFYAEFAVVPEKNVAPVPGNLEMDQAGGLPACGVTGMAGLDALDIGKDGLIMILGASGGIGHLAVQFGKRMRSRTLAVASGKDGVDLVRRLGADHAVDGRDAGHLDAVKKAAPGGADAALVFANSEALAETLKHVKKGGKIAYPNGVDPEPKGPAGVKVKAFDGLPDPKLFERMNKLIAMGPFHVEINRTYRLEQAAQAHRDVEKHHLGKLAFRIQE